MGPADSLAEDTHPNTPDSVYADERQEWNVRVEILMVAVPESDALTILPKLRDPLTIESGVTTLLERIRRKEAILMGYPMLTSVTGNRALAECIIEERYPTEFQPPSLAQTAALQTPKEAASGKKVKDSRTTIGFFPTAFETRNAGVTLEMEPLVSMNGKWIHLNLVPQRVALWHYNAFESWKTEDGKVMKVEQPQFLTNKVTTSIKVKDGERRLIGVHKLTDPAGHLEFFILQATAEKIE